MTTLRALAAGKMLVLVTEWGSPCGTTVDGPDHPCLSRRGGFALWDTSTGAGRAHEA